ncbi:hypothetical protein FSP39_022946 [Pinctada imbricata]|uniref:Coiled-coil protein 142 C-terminal domain-containing protein n=1 Tax=Pinctada imbricata TaxID=66713 RepID=A0AA88Y7N5_PINIB|nr:hypothetical protein FSP39_022946 [Pinctada imbricata]
MDIMEGGEEDVSHSANYGEISRVHIPGLEESYESYDGTSEFYRSYGVFPKSQVHQEAREKVFDVIEAEECLKLLRKPFRILNPGDHVSKRTSEHSSISFMHCRHIGGIGKQYVRLRQVMEERARLEFMRDCLFRIKSVAAFVEDLEHLVREEYLVYDAVTHNSLMEAPVSKIYCLNALCEDLRTHIGQWNNIKQGLHTNKWLQPILGQLYLDLEYIRKTMSHLYSGAIFWMDKLINIGLQVFAHGDMATLTQEVLWNIARGLEDFNNVANSLSKGKYINLHYMIPDYLSSDFTLMSCKCDASMSNHPGLVASTVKAIPFSRILNVIANERAKYAAIETHRFFTSNDEFLKILYSGHLPAYVWNDEVQSQGHAGHLLDTSDYHTASSSLTSISGAILKVGPVRAPDLTNHDSPLVDFARLEKDFAENFLLIVCNSTNLLRKNDSHSKSKHKANKSPSKSKPPKGQDTPVLSRSDSKRKSVSWGDSADGAIKAQLTEKYMEVLWKHFAKALEMCFYEPAWGHRGHNIADLGSITLCNATVIALIRNMMEHVCLKDMFPSRSVPSILSVARKLHSQSALTSWDIDLCTALGCQTSDKCYPCPLASGDYSTRTGMLIRDAYQPVFSILQEYMKDLSEAGKDASVLLPKQDLDLPHITSLVCRLLTNCQVSHTWCANKSNSFLSSWLVGNFLLITQTDLKILADETKKALNHAQMFCGKTIHRSRQADEQMMLYLKEISKQIADVNGQLQTLSGAAMKIFTEFCGKKATEYFQSEMPQGKVWKKKSAQDFPTQHNMYIEHALETILEPVIEGVSKLKQTAQLSAISMATTAFCDALKNTILKNKIKFSYLGACQLSVDVGFMRAWLGEYIVNSEVRHSILELSVFRYLNGAILLLKKQPYRRGAGKVPRALLHGRSQWTFALLRISCGPSSDNASTGSKADRMSQSADIEATPTPDESDIQYVNNIDDWLNLRVQGSSRGWKLTSCLNAPETVD